MLYRYHLAGYVFESNIQIPELVPTKDLPDCKIIVSKAISNDIPASALEADFFSDPSRSLVCFFRKHMGFVSVKNKYILEYVPPETFTEAEIRMNILGSVAAIMATSLGYVSLHASCVIMNGKAVLFCGKSGAGKSSIAAYFHSKGYPVFSDDVTPIKSSLNQVSQVYSSVPRINLSSFLLEILGEDEIGLEQIQTKRLKFALPMHHLNPEEKYPIGAIIFPEFNEGACNIEIRLGMRKKSELFKHVFRKRLSAQVLGPTLKKKVFELISNVAMYTYYRPSDGAQFLESSKYLEQELLDILK